MRGSHVPSKFVRLQPIAVVSLIFFLVFGSLLATAKKEAPVWSVDLEKRYGLQPFDRDISAKWTGQQGVVFLTADKVLVYQVNRAREQRELSARGKSGGAGNFALMIRVMDAHDGHDLKQLDLTTNAMQSSVTPVSDGRFVVRTGDQMFLYSGDFQRLAQKELPLKRAASTETWTIAVSPSGAEMALIHAQIFYDPQLLADGTVMNEGKALTDVEILDPSTLQTRKQFTLQHSLVFWALLDGKFVSSDPAHSYSHGEIGTLDFDGHWKLITTGFKIEHNECPYHMAAVGADAVALFGCEKILGLSTAGQKLFSRDDASTSFNSISARGDYLALACDRYRMGRISPTSSTFVQTVPDRLEVMRVSKFEKVFSIPLKNERLYFEVSPWGRMAVVEGSQLRMFGVER